MRFLRRLVPAVLGLGLLAGSLAGCEWPDGTRYVDVVFAESQIQVTRDIVYRSTTNWQGVPVDLKLDVYEPPASRDHPDRPVVMWMFGGAWVLGNRTQMASWAMDSARRGYVAVNIDYRIRAIGENIIDAGWDAYDDSVAAVEWIKAHAADFDIDPDAIVAGGVSAGAINAMHMLYAPGQRPTGPTTSPIAGGVAISGLSFVPAQGVDPPSIMHQGTADPITPIQTADSICKGAAAQGSECNWFQYEGAGHGLPGLSTQVRDTTALMIFERVLWAKGYRPEFPNNT